MYKLFRKRRRPDAEVDLSLPEKPNKSHDVIIHIGAPKTGSSAIQKYLLENRRKLQTLGYYYPEHELDENGISGGHSIFGLNVANDNLSEARDLFETWLSQAKNRKLALLISAESLFNYPDRLNNITSSYRCKIISFYRDPIDAIYSNYNQSVKRNYTTSTFEYVCEKILRSDSAFYSGRIFTKWAEIFGSDNLGLAVYDSDLLDRLPIQAVFLTMLEIPEAEIKSLSPKKVQFINKSYSPGALEFKRLINHVLDHDNNGLNNGIDCILQRLSDQSGCNKPDISSILSPSLIEMLINRLRKPAQLALKDYITTPRTITPGHRPPKERLATSKIRELIEIKTIIETLEATKPEVLEYIIKRTKDALSHRDTSYSLFKLAEMLSIDNFNPNIQENWFTKKQLENMASGEFQEADYLRVIANLLLLRNNFKAAHQLATRALKLRPGGPVIIKLNQEIEGKLKETS